eukprot:SAG11_NODE_1078_length_5963_cov_5.690825_4_plen_36_part_00
MRTITERVGPRRTPVLLVGGVGMDASGMGPLGSIL